MPSKLYQASVVARDISWLRVKATLQCEARRQNGKCLFPSGKVRVSFRRRTVIESALKETRGNRRKAAQMLDIGERTLYRKVREYGIPVEGLQQHRRHEPLTGTTFHPLRRRAASRHRVVHRGSGECVSRERKGKCLAERRARNS